MIARTVVLLLSPLLLAAASRPAAGSPPAPRSQPAARYTLEQLLRRAHQVYPGIAAKRHAVEAMRQKLRRAKWAWLPQANFNAFFAPSTSVHCQRPVEDAAGNLVYGADGAVITEPDTERCLQTDSYDLDSFKWDSIILRVRLEAGMPLYTFGKISAAKRAATAGVAARTAQVRMARDTLTGRVVQAYWGLKLAREVIQTIKDGRRYLLQAIDKLDRDLDAEEGEGTITDLLELKTAKVEIAGRLLEAQRGEAMALAALTRLAGLDRARFDIDRAPLAPLHQKPAPLEDCLARAMSQRPDLTALRAAINAARAGVSLERASFLPDLLLVGYLDYLYAPNVDRTRNAFFNNPFNTVGAGVGLTLNWKIDPLQQWGKYRESVALRKELAAERDHAQLGVKLQVEEKLTGLDGAYQRLKLMARGKKVARSWLVSISQSINAGLRDTKDLTKSLVAYFKARLQHAKAIYDVNVGWAALERAIGSSATAAR